MSTFSSVVFLPWLGPADYICLRQMKDGDYLPPTYQDWLTRAVAQAMDLLASGCSAQIVNLKIEDYFDWLHQHCLPDTAEARAQYLSHVAHEVGCEVENVCWPWPVRPNAAA